MKNFQKRTKNFITLTLAVVLMALAVGCGSNTDANAKPETEQTANSDASAKIVGEGSKQFDFTVVQKDGSETSFEVHTDKETVGEALTELDLIAGEEGEYGLYVKTVNGITVDYDTDGAYWAFYVNDEYSQTSVDQTVIEDGCSYSFRVE